MKRNEFFSALTLSAGLFYVAPVLTSCSKSMNDATTTTPGNSNNGNNNNGAVDFNLDLSSSNYSVLNTNGGSVVLNSIIVAKTTSGNFVALSAVCTHQGGPIGYDSSADRFHCPNHGSNFSSDGTVINGPAASPLKKYNTQLTGTTLRVYA